MRWTDVVCHVFTCTAFTVTCVIEPAVPIVGMLLLVYLREKSLT